MIVVIIWPRLSGLKLSNSMYSKLLRQILYHWIYKRCGNRKQLMLDIFSLSVLVWLENECVLSTAVTWNAGLSVTGTWILCTHTMHGCICVCTRHVCACTWAFVNFSVWVRKSECAMCEVLSLQSCVWGGGGNGGCIKCMPEVALAT